MCGVTLCLLNKNYCFVTGGSGVAEVEEAVQADPRPIRGGRGHQDGPHRHHELGREGAADVVFICMFRLCFFSRPNRCPPAQKHGAAFGVFFCVVVFLLCRVENASRCWPIYGRPTSFC